MNIYVSINNKKTIKKYYPNLLTKDVVILDIPNYAKLNKYNNYSTDIIQQYLLNQDIKKMLNNYYRSKRFKSILYIIDKIDDDFIDDFFQFLELEKIYFIEYILIDCEDKIDHELYNYFTNVI